MDADTSDSSGEWPSQALERRGGNEGYSLTVNYKWPPDRVLFTRKKVRVFQLFWHRPDFGDHCYESEKAMNVLGHYKGHLEVVKLARIEDVKLLRFIDGLNIKELYIGRVLVKTYPGSSKVVTALKLGEEVEAEVLVELLQGCRNSLTSFSVQPVGMEDYCMAYWYDERVAEALGQCSLLRKAKVWCKWYSKLRALRALRTLTLCHFGEYDEPTHEDLAALLRVSSRRLRRLTLRMGYFAHPGLIKAVAEGCPDLRLLRLMWDQATERRGFTVTVDLPSNLHTILAPLAHLERLAVYFARVPSPVLDGLAGGALPGLRVLELHSCAVTPLAHESLQSLRASRPSLRVEGDKLETAVRDWGEEDDGRHLSSRRYWVAVPQRCKQDVCVAADLDQHEEDPVPGPHIGDSDDDSEMMTSMEPLRSCKDPSDDEDD